MRTFCAQFVRWFQGFARVYVRRVPCQRIWLMIISFPRKSQKCCSGLAPFVVFPWHSVGVRTRVDAPGQSSGKYQRPSAVSHTQLLPTRRIVFAHFLRNGAGFVPPEFVDSGFPGHGIAPPPPPPVPPTPFPTSAVRDEAVLPM